MPPVRRKLAKASSGQAQNGNVFLWSKHRCLLRIDDLGAKAHNCSLLFLDVQNWKLPGDTSHLDELTPLPCAIANPPPIRGFLCACLLFVYCLYFLSPSLPSVMLRCQAVQGITIDFKLFRVTFPSL